MRRIGYCFFLLIYFLIFKSSLFAQIVLQGTITDNGSEFLGDGSALIGNALVKVMDCADTSLFFINYTDVQDRHETIIKGAVVVRKPWNLKTIDH
jgi:hypothetical protein